MPGDTSARNLLGASYELLTGFAQQWAETSAAATQNALGRKIEFADVAFAATSYMDVIEEFGGVAHAAMEVKVSFGPNDAFLLGFLSPATDAALLFGLNLEAAVLNDDEKLAEASDSIRRSCSEICDLLGLMLFAATPERADISVGEVLFNRVEESIGIVADVAGETVAARLDADLVLPDGSRSRLTTIFPLKFLLRLAEALTPEEPAAPVAAPPPVVAAAPAPTPISAAPGYAAAPTAPAAVAAAPQENLVVHPAAFTQLRTGDGAAAGHTLDLILDVTLRITVELGRNTMTVAEVLGLGPGSVVELDRQAGEPVDILVNDKLIAHGEVVVVEENFGVRILEIISPQGRVAALA